MGKYRLLKEQNQKLQEENLTLKQENNKLWTKTTNTVPQMLYAEAAQRKRGTGNNNPESKESLKNDTFHNPEKRITRKEDPGNIN